MFNPIMGNLIFKIFSFAKNFLRFIDCHRVNFVEYGYFLFFRKKISMVNPVVGPVHLLILGLFQVSDTSFENTCT